MTLGEFRAATQGRPDSAEMAILNAQNGEDIHIEDISSTNATVVIEVRG